MENPKPYDLEERTSVFAESIIIFLQSFKKDPLVLPLLTQLIRAATSVGANYCEANGASSKKDFLNKIFLCKKEIKETKYWLRMLARAVPEKSEECGRIWQEAQELTMIFSKIAASTKNV